MAPEPSAHWRDRLDDHLILLDRWRSDRRAVAVALAALVGLALVAWLNRPQPAGGAGSTAIEAVIPLASVTTSPPDTNGPIIVHVVGAVNRPGVYELDSTARVIDVIEAAGGVVADADLAQINLAAPAPDGSQIVVARQGEEVSQPIRGSTSDDPEEGSPVPLNGATASQLESLPGVGPATAAAIVAWRDESGPFRTVDQLLEVPGIGPAKFDALADLVVVG